MDKKTVAGSTTSVNSGSGFSQPEETSASSQAIVPREAEGISASLQPHPEGMTNEELVVRVRAGFQKIAAEIPYIVELRARFARLTRGKANIGGCRTWKEFCEKILKRTDRRIRQVVAANSILDKSKSVGLPAHKTKHVDMPPASSCGWDTVETSRRCFAYVINSLEHLSSPEANQALVDLIAKLQDERRERIEPAKAAFKVKIKTPAREASR